MAITLNGTTTVSVANNFVSADYSNATLTARVSFQTSTTNGSTGIYALPNGTSTAASWQAANNADPTNASKILIATNGSTDVQLVSGINGTGTYLPLTFYTSGSEKMRLDISGNVGIGTSSPGTKLDAYTSGSASTILRTRNDTTTVYLDANNGYSYLNTYTNHPMLFGTNNTERGRFDTSGNFYFNSGYGSSAVAYGCRAWLNYSGTGTPTIRGSGNVTSVTKNGTGDYTINFASAFPDATYCATTNTYGASLTDYGTAFITPSDSAPTTTTLRIAAKASSSGTRFDAAYLFVSVFR